MSGLYPNEFRLRRAADGFKRSWDKEGTIGSGESPSHNVRALTLFPSIGAKLSSEVLTSSLIDVAGAIEDGAEITISTTELNFGKGPVVYQYDDFADIPEGSTPSNYPQIGPAGVDYKLVSAGIRALSAKENRGKLRAVHIASNALGSGKIVVRLPNVTELYQCYSFRVPYGYSNAGAKDNQQDYPGEPGYTPDDSAWKHFWTRTPGAGSDVISPTLNGRQWVTGNNTHTSTSAVVRLPVRTSAQPGAWCFTDHWFRANPENLKGADGVEYIGVATPAYGFAFGSDEGSVFSANASVTYYDETSMNSWFDYNPLALAYGAQMYNASNPARVILTDHPILRKSGRIVLCPPLEWDTSAAEVKTIKVWLKEGDIDLSKEPGWLHIFNADNEPLLPVGYLINPGVVA